MCTDIPKWGQTNNEKQFTVTRLKRMRGQKKNETLYFLLDYDLCHRLTSPFDHPGRLHLIKSGLNQYTDKE